MQNFGINKVQDCSSDSGIQFVFFTFYSVIMLFENFLKFLVFLIEFILKYLSNF